MKTTFIRNKPYAGPVQGVILDWAGTAVDYGCVGPVAVFTHVFKKSGVKVSTAEARMFMGLTKKDHIRKMCELSSVSGQWRRIYGRTPSETDVDNLYEETEPMMVSTVARYADPIPGLLDTLETLRKRGIKIGSTTGYTSPIMEKLIPAARDRGYDPDAVVCPSDAPAGRPYPWMCYQNAIELEIYPLEAMVKIGDTVNDIHEGLNAGMWTIGLTKSGNGLGLTEEEVEKTDPEELKTRLETIEQELLDSGAHYTAEGIWECLPIIDDINDRLSRGEQPL